MDNKQLQEVIDRAKAKFVKAREDEGDDEAVKFICDLFDVGGNALLCLNNIEYSLSRITDALEMLARK